MKNPKLPQRKSITGYFIFLFICCYNICHASAENQPILYQGVLRDLNGYILAEQEMRLEFIIYDKDEIVFHEKHILKTDLLGRYEARIGRGKTITGNFNQIPWSKELQTQTIINGKTLEKQNVYSIPLSQFARECKSLEGKTFNDSNISQTNYWSSEKIQSITQNFGQTALAKEIEARKSADLALLDSIALLKKENKALKIEISNLNKSSIAALQREQDKRSEADQLIWDSIGKITSAVHIVKERNYCEVSDHSKGVYNHCIPLYLNDSTGLFANPFLKIFNQTQDDTLFDLSRYEKLKKSYRTRVFVQQIGIDSGKKKLFIPTGNTDIEVYVDNVLHTDKEEHTYFSYECLVFEIEFYYREFQPSRIYVTLIRE